MPETARQAARDIITNLRAKLVEAHAAGLPEEMRDDATAVLCLFESIVPGSRQEDGLVALVANLMAEVHEESFASFMEEAVKAMVDG